MRAVRENAGANVATPREVKGSGDGNTGEADDGKERQRIRRGERLQFLNPTEWGDPDEAV